MRRPIDFDNKEFSTRDNSRVRYFAAGVLPNVFCETVLILFSKCIINQIPNIYEC
jgi:hypothetical protein